MRDRPRGTNPFRDFMAMARLKWRCDLAGWSVGSGMFDISLVVIITPTTLTTYNMEGKKNRELATNFQSEHREGEKGEPNSPTAK